MSSLGNFYICDLIVFLMFLFGEILDCTKLILPKNVITCLVTSSFIKWMMSFNNVFCKNNSKPYKVYIFMAAVCFIMWYRTLSKVEVY